MVSGAQVAKRSGRMCRPAIAQAVATVGLWLMSHGQAASQALSPVPDPERGQQIAHSRTQGLCVLCHAMPGVPPHLAGDLGPALHGVASRRSAAFLREQLLHPQRLNPHSIMPSYAAPPNSSHRVAASQAGLALLSPTQVEDVLAYLQTLR